jgi:uncharacterized membrane protein YdjX (TVP38/TMEM64 family)
MKRALVAVSFLVLVGYAAWSYSSGGIIELLLRPDIQSEIRLAQIQEYFRSWGAAAPLAYALIVTVEVVLAPIPGTLLYLPGGVIFGGFVGGSMSLAGNVLGAGIACHLIRALDGPYVERYLERDALKKYEAVIEKQGLWIVFLLRVNPLTSSDLVSYAAGLTRLPVWKVMTGTLLGMAPLCYMQAYFAQELFAKFPRLIYPLILIGIAYGVFVIKILRQLVKKSSDRSGALATQEGQDG